MITEQGWANESLSIELDVVQCDYRIKAHKSPIGAVNPNDLLIYSEDGGWSFGDRHKASKPGECVFLPSGMAHTLVLPHDSTLCSIFFRVLLYGSINVLSFMSIPRIIAKGPARELAATMRHIEAANHGDSPLKALVETHRWGCTLAAQLMDLGSFQPQATSELEKRITYRSWLEHLEKRIESPVQLAELAADHALSPSRYSHRFQELFGMAPMSWLRQRRLQRAKSWLIEKVWPISEIAEKLSYCDAFQFSKQFKKHTGHSPSAYRKRFRNWQAQLGINPISLKKD